MGGSYIGLELGQIFARLGSWVTILHRADRLVEREDADVSGIIADIMRGDGIDLRLNARLASVGRSMRGVLVTLEDGAEIAASHILFATGRVPNTDKLNPWFGGADHGCARLSCDRCPAKDGGVWHLGAG